MTWRWARPATSSLRKRNNRIRNVVFPGPTLVLNSVGVGNGGAYDVVVSSPYGSVTSSVVNLAVPDTNPPVLAITSPTPGQLWSNAAFTVTGTATDNVAVASVFYSLNSGGWEQRGNV